MRAISVSHSLSLCECGFNIYVSVTNLSTIQNGQNNWPLKEVFVHTKFLDNTPKLMYFRHVSTATLKDSLVGEETMVDYMLFKLNSMEKFG